MDPEYVENNKLSKYYDNRYTEEDIINDDNQSAFDDVVVMAKDIIIEVCNGLTLSEFCDTDANGAKDLVYEFFKDSGFCEDTKKLIFDCAMESILEYYFTSTIFSN